MVARDKLLVMVFEMLSNMYPESDDTIVIFILLIFKSTIAKKSFIVAKSTIINHEPIVSTVNQIMNQL